MSRRHIRRDMSGKGWKHTKAHKVDHAGHVTGNRGDAEPVMPEPVKAEEKELDLKAAKKVVAPPAEEEEELELLFEEVEEVEETEKKSKTAKRSGRKKKSAAKKKSSR